MSPLSFYNTFWSTADGRRSGTYLLSGATKVGDTFQTRDESKTLQLTVKVLRMSPSKRPLIAFDILAEVVAARPLAKRSRQNVSAYRRRRKTNK